ncbi:MAG TPA: class I SAM-dependent methyltransferase [Solirubrobacteraceae bacterium]|jgi:SAM-dependent methyltransferase|nr:class I SAM-dependent methyltransferase [Solirubrobacteraceae bacterium]
MPHGTLQRSYGTVFDRVAASYDRHRPSYPEELIDRACEAAGLTAGDEVLEIGCATGQLTRSLLARGLRVTAIEPGERLVGLARQNLAGTGDVRFLNTRLEDARLPRERFSAVLCASAIHWVDPDVGWRRAAEALVPDGTLALVQHFGVNDRHSAEDQRALLGAMAAVAPEIAADWPSYRDLQTTLAGVHERRENISEVWAWLGGYDIARAHAADLFDEVQIAAAPTSVEHTAEELNSVLGTMSFWARLSPTQRAALQSENRALHERIGRPIRSSTLACLVTARRASIERPGG